MKHLKKTKRLSLILGPIVAFVLILQMMGTISLSGLAYDYYNSGCPTNESAITSYYLRITRDGSTFSASTFSSVRSGDKVKVVFDIDDRCTSTNVPVSLVSYKAPSSTWYDSAANQRVLYQSQTGYFNKYGGSQEIYIPNCYYSTGFVYGSVITNMTSTNHYDGRRVDWRDGGGSACSTSTTTTTTTSCPADKTAITSYYFTLNGGTTRYYDLDNVRQGDDVYAYFTLKSGCTNVPVSFAAYTAKEPYWNVNTASQQVYQPATNDTGVFSSGATRMVHTKVPVCYFQIDFVYGGIINPLNPNSSTGLYGDKKIEWLNGGTNACGSGPGGAELPTPTLTKTPTKTPTPITPTNTPVPPTNTPVPPTNTPTGPGTTEETPVPPTNTPVPPTNTPVPPTATPEPTQTPIPPGALQIHVRDSAGAALGGATVEIQFGLTTSSVTDNGAGDADPANGEIRLNNLEPGNYLGTQTGAAEGYWVDPTSDSATVPAGGVGEMTFINTRPGTLHVLLQDSDENPLPGGCFQVNGPSGYSNAICDGGSGDTDGANDGTVVVTGLLAGTYDGTQTTVPDGYVGDASNPSTLVPEGGIGTLVFVNTVPPGTLIIELNANVGGAGLAGGCFTVTGPNDYSNAVCTGDGGTVSIDGLTPGSYTATQTSPAPGYILGDDREETGSVPSAGSVTLSFVNYQLGSLVINLEDQVGAPLNGCFDVTGGVGNVCITDGSGSVRIDNLIPGSYDGTQSTGPEGYELDADTESANVPEGGVAEMNFVNNAPQVGTILIHKDDDLGDNLPGACFIIGGTSGDATGYELLVCDRGFDDEYGDGNADGEIAVTGLPLGGYEVYEAEAPAGYLADETPQYGTLDAGETLEFTFVNHPESDTPDGRYVAIYKLNCTSDPGPINWDLMPNNVPANCELAEGVGFDYYEPGNPEGGI